MEFYHPAKHFAIFISFFSPLAGLYSIHSLSHRLLKASWDELQHLKEDGWQVLPHGSAHSEHKHGHWQRRYPGHGYLWLPFASPGVFQPPATISAQSLFVEGEILVLTTQE